MIDHAARAEDVRWLADTGESATRAAARLGMTFDALEKYCRAHGLADEWRTMRRRDPREIVDMRDVARRNAERRWAS